MSINNCSALFPRMASAVRFACVRLAVIVAAAVSIGSNATAEPARPLELTAPCFVGSASSDIFDQSPTPFAGRFEYPQSSWMRDVIDRAFDRDIVQPIVNASLQGMQTIVAAGAAILGAASTYNPADPSGADSDPKETASGELYDAEDWTAAIRTDLRAQFGGVHFGKNYRPAFALVQSDDKEAIVRINDVGPLKPGRVIDLNERAMRYFDPALRRGVLDNVKITPLAGQEWTVGPVAETPIGFARRGGGEERLAQAAD